MINKSYNLTDDTWHKVAKEDNIWIKWRFDLLKKTMRHVGISLSSKL